MINYSQMAFMAFQPTYTVWAYHSVGVGSHCTVRQPERRSSWARRLRTWGIALEDTAVTGWIWVTKVGTATRITRRKTRTRQWRIVVCLLFGITIIYMTQPLLLLLWLCTIEISTWHTSRCGAHHDELPLASRGSDEWSSSTAPDCDLAKLQLCHC